MSPPTSPQAVGVVVPTSDGARQGQPLDEPFPNRWRADSVTALCIFVALLLGIPSSWSVRALGSIGSPATIIGLAAFFWWCWYQLHRATRRHVRVQPVRWAIAILLLMTVVSYARAVFLPMSADEVSPAESGLIRLVSLFGIALVANDGIRTPRRMHILVRFVVAGAALVAAFSVVQFITGEVWIDKISIPGLTQNAAFELGQRQGLTRPTGTASHPIELASMLTMVLPLAILSARSDDRIRFSRILMIGTIFLGIVLSLSRTAILCLVIGLALTLPSLPRRWRIAAGVAGLSVMGVLYVTVPGLVGTLRGLFVGLSNDPSVQSRTDSFGLVLQFISRSPWIGRGLGTFLPKYWILDNMYLQLLIEIGLLGVLALLGVLFTAMIVGWKARNRFTGIDRNLATGIVAGVASGTASLAFFDTFAFPQSSVMLFLLVGMSGAYWRLARRHHVPGRKPSPEKEASGVKPSPEAIDVPLIGGSDALRQADPGLPPQRPQPRHVE